MAHIKTTAVEVKSDSPNGAYLSFHGADFPGVGVWHLGDTHPQFVHLSRGVVSFLVFDNWDAASTWIGSQFSNGDRLFGARNGNLVEVTAHLLRHTADGATAHTVNRD